jgi:hypothetical protein
MVLLYHMVLGENEVRGTDLVVFFLDGGSIRE